ncbi:unnamed protein product [Closterium sp. Naga37s-1]|nr:unnamed protein product [Closterium sp. Naga37s-1]
MASLSPAEDSPETVPEKPPDRRVSGLDFLRPSVAPITPEHLVIAAVVNTDDLPSSSKDPQPAPNPAPAPAPFTLPPTIAPSSKGPQPPPNPAPASAPFTLPPAIASSSKGPQPPPNPAPAPAPFTLPPAIPSSSKAPPFAVGPGNGGRDLQTHTMRIHEHTTVHKEAMQHQAEIAETISNGQTKIDRFINADVEGRRAIRLMRSVQFLCQEDAPISMFPKLMRHLAEQDTPDIPKQAYGVYLTREALAVKDAATANPDLAMVDTVVRTLAERLGASCHWNQRFKYLQRVIYNTNLEVQGIHSVRWLSRGDAVKRLCKVLGAAIVLFHEKEHELYETVTSYKFQFCLFFLADILGDLNDLNHSFQKRQSLKKRRPAQSVLFPSDDRKRKEKEPEEEEEEPREPAGEEGSFAESDDHRDDNQETDQDIEQSPPRGGR